MAKKKKEDKKASRTETVRSAVDQAFQATAQATADAGQLTRGRATEIADELVGNITRLRDALEDVRPATTEDVKALREEISNLVDRVAKLELDRASAAVQGTDAPKPAPPAKTGATKPAPAARKKPAPAKPSARASATRTAAAKRTTAAAAAAGSKPKPAAPAKTGAAKPAAPRKPAAAKAPAKRAAPKPASSS